MFTRNIFVPILEDQDTCFVDLDGEFRDIFRGRLFPSLGIIYIRLFSGTETPINQFQHSVAQHFEQHQTSPRVETLLTGRSVVTRRMQGSLLTSKSCILVTVLDTECEKFIFFPAVILVLV